jgi:hypothetical protein
MLIDTEGVPGLAPQSVSDHERRAAKYTGDD